MITELTLQEKIEVAAEQIENSLEIGFADDKKQIRLILTQFAKAIANGTQKSDEKCTLPFVMPRRLTAENGAKGLLIGEFHETIVCHDDEGEPYEVKMPVEWDTIKSIYAKIVEHYGA